MIRVAPPITVQHISGMAQCLVVVKLILIFFHRVPKEYTNQHPGPNVESVKSNIHLTCGFSHICEVGPVEIFIACPYDAIRNPV